MISIVVPLYNKALKITSTLEAIFNQEYTDYEVIIVNDGSTDGSEKIVESISDPRIRIIHQANFGVSAARNRGIKESQGEYIAFLDADDEWMPNYLASQVALIDKYPECAIYGTNYEFKKTNGDTSSTMLRNIRVDGADGVLENYFEVASTSHPPLWTSAVVVRKSAIESIGGFPVGIKSGEDLLTWARLACRYNIAYSRKVCAIFNVEGYETDEKPKRVPAEEDVVGRELKKLAKEFNPPHINDYLSLWHKMRSSVYMRLRMRGPSIREALKGLRYNPLNYKLYAFIALNLLPSKIQPF